MRNRTIRLTLLTLLFAAAIGAGLVAWSAEQRVHLLSATEQAEIEHLNRIAELLSALGSVQLAYSASTPADQGWFGHVSRLVEQIDAEASAIVTPGLDDPSPQLREFRDAAAVVTQATARARDNMAAGRDLMAADIVLEETRASVEAVSNSLARLRAFRVASFASERNALEQRTWTVVGAVAGLWALSFVLLVVSRGRDHTSRAEATESLSITPSSARLATPNPDSSQIDLSAVAELCAAISRITSSQQLSAVLSRAASIIDASGIVLWIGAGEQLQAIGFHGYDLDLITRISPIPVTVRNPTTDAWHSGEMRTIGGHTESSAAIAAPMSGPFGRVGVLTTELRSDRASEPHVQAVVAMIAAQFSMAFAPADVPVAAPSRDHHTTRLPLNAGA